MMLHFIDCTEFVRLRDAAETTRPAIAVIAIDNYEELVKNTTDSEKSNILAGIDKRLFAWVKDSSAVLRKYDRDKYIFVSKTSSWTSWSRASSPFCRRCAKLRTTRAL